MVTRPAPEGRPIDAAAPRVPVRLASFAAALVLAVTFVAAPVPAAAATTADVAGMVLTSMNGDRADQGLVRYRTWEALSALATERAQQMANLRTLSHNAAGGDVGLALDARGIDWMGYGEIIGMTGWGPGQQAADSLTSMWMSSDPHRAIMRSADFNYVGVGIAQASDGSTWASIVVTESLDHTLPVAQVASLVRSGDDLTFRWSGADPRLQTHTAGVQSFDVQFRRDDGSWTTIRDDTTSTKVRRKDRVHGHWYFFRVQARDGRGNLSAWTVEKRIWVP